MKDFVSIVFFLFFINPVISQDTAYEEKFAALYDKVDEFAYTQKDSANYYLGKAYALSKTQQDWENAFWLLVQWDESAAYFYDLQTFRKNLAAMDSLVAAYQKEVASAPDSKELQNTPVYYNGLYNFELHDYEKSRKSFEKIIDQVERSPDSLNTSFQLDMLRAAYSFMAKMYFNEGKYELAKDFYSKNIRFLKAKIPDDTENLFRNYSLLAEVYKAEGNYRLSNDFFIRSLNYNEKNQTSINSIITETDHIIGNYIHLSQPDSANYYLARLQKILPKDHPFEHKYYQAQAKVLMSENRPEEAFSALEKALTATRRKWDFKKHVEEAIAYMEIGDFHTKRGAFKKALDNYKLALGQLKPFNKTDRLNILKNIAIALNRLNTDEYRIEALKTVDLAIATLDSLKPSFTSNQDKQLLIEDAFPLFEAGIEAAFARYESSGNQRYLAKVFQYMEKGKSTLLLDALLSAKANQFAGIPQELLENEQQLKAEIADNEKKMTLQKLEGPEPQEILFRLKEKHRKLIRRFETDYPNYYALRYDTDVVTLATVRGLLDKDQLLISYFYGVHNLYALAISPDSVSIKKIKITLQLEKDVKGFAKMLSNPKSAIDSLSSTGNVLYSALLRPLLSGHSSKRLIIIPDGPLNYLPFSSLNTGIKKVKYLIEQYAVSYASSATLLYALKAKKNAENKLLAFAPGFNTPGTADAKAIMALTPLPNSIREIEGIAHYFPEVSYTGNKATLTNFRSMASSSSMIHLATHALANNASPEYSFLAFAPGEKEHLLFVRDLYDMHIPADLVTLSACETGTGELRRGEGLISLSRAFFYSGAKSLVNTLWNINDNSATEIMSNFYRNLAHGKSKDRALRMAKLAFIRKHSEDNLSHPYYWSSFVISGNVSPVTGNSEVWWIFGSFAILLSLTALIFYQKRRKSVI